MNRVSMTNFMPAHERKSLIARGIIIMMILSSLLQILVPLPDEEKSDYETELIAPLIETALVATSNLSNGDYTKGGYHLKTGEWWEGKLDYIPSINDPDGDGVESTNDSHPWDRNLGASVKDCSSGCEAGLPPNIEDSTTMPSSLPTSAVHYEMGDLNLDGTLDLVFSDSSRIYYSLNYLSEFETPIQIAYVAHNSDSIKVVDFDNDGDLDILTAGSYTIKLLEMNGTQLVSINNIFSTTYIQSYYRFDTLDIGDVNADGYPDFVVGGVYGGGFNNPGFDGANFRLFVNNYSSSGTITFDNVWNYSLTTHATYYPGQAITFNDYDSDGDDDVFISSFNHSSTPCDDSGTKCWAIMGYYSDPNNDPPLESSPDYMFDCDEAFGSYYSARASALNAGDLNGDGYNELLIGTGDGKLYSLWNLEPNSGTPGYGQEETGNYTELYGKGFDSVSNLGLVDINNDGLLDIYSGSRETDDESTILISKGFEIAGEAVEFEYSWNSSTGIDSKLLIGDIDANGFQDIIIATSGNPLSFIRTGAGTLGDSSSTSMSTLTYGYGHGTLIDYDGDGDDDLVVGASNATFFENENGIFSSNPSYWVNKYSHDLHAADFNNDGYDELIIGAWEAEIRWGSSEGYNSTADIVLNPGNNSDRFDHIEIIDVNGDGNLDIIFDSYYSYSDYGYVYTYDGNGDFELFWTSQSQYSESLRETNIIDINDDSINDYVQCMWNEIRVYNGTSTVEGMNTILNFSADYYEIPVAPSYQYDCVMDDFNQDGIIDIIQQYSSHYYVLFGPLANHSGTQDDYFYLQSSSSIELGDIDMDGHNDIIVATHSSKKSSVISYDGIDDEIIWEGGAYRSTYNYYLGDVDSDGIADLIQFNQGSNTELIYGVSDLDMDGYPDSDDEFESNPTQHKDTDGDGYGDSITGFEADDCVYYWGDSTEDRRGCTDQDQDGYSDLNDAFWRDNTQWNDTDGDGLGDNYQSNTGRESHWPGEFVQNARNPDSEPLDYDNDGYEDSDLSDAISPFDDCKMIAGESYEDSYGCLDSDLDGWSNFVDVFPIESSQHNDTDNDGFGDNTQGWLGDYCPNTYGTSATDVYGCTDADGDGWSNLNDFDDNDSNEYVDTDGDGLGDMADQCQYSWSNLSTGPDKGCPDSDGDGVADRSDDFSTDATQTTDSDGDGYGDNQSGNSPDAFPMDSSQWSDSDGDRRGDNANGNNPDAFPNDNTQWDDADGDGYGENQSGNNPDRCVQPGSSEQRLFSNGSSENWYGCPDSDDDKIPDQFDDCQGTSGYSFVDRIGCIDSDEDGISDLNDPYMYHYSSGAITGDWDDDGVLDFRPDFNLSGSDVFPDDWSQDTDNDRDGYGDNPNGENADWDINDPTQWKDSDGDGYGDNSSGTNGDACPNEWGDSTDVKTGLGCPDSDGDTISDDSDDFKYDSTQNKDTDGDGYGDSAEGQNPDAFPNDSSQWSDRDNDGYGDNPEGNNSDDFPYDSTQWTDSDGDGYGDNPNGNNPDSCINSAGTSFRDRLGCTDQDDDGYSDKNDECVSLPGWSGVPYQGCPDRDDDGIADIIDAFPDDDTENRDSDGDGIGDNSDTCYVVVWEDDYSYDNDTMIDCTFDKDNDGRNDSEDEYPEDPTEWIDSDDDGVGDNHDRWPSQPEIWSDVDLDGYADQFGHPLTDDCPSINGPSTKFMQGCSDMDFDGMPDLLDPDADGDGITNDNEMDASTKDEEYDPFDNTSTPPDMDGDGIPDLLDKDTDGDGFPNSLENERGSDYRDNNETPFNLYGEQDTGLYYIPGEGFKSQYDPEGIELSVSALLTLLTGEFLIPIMMIPLTIFALLRKGRRYKKMRRSIGNCRDLDILKEYETDIDDVIMKKKIKVEHGMLLRNLFERKRQELDTGKAISGLKRGSSSGQGGSPSRPGAAGRMAQGERGGGSGSQRSDSGPRRPGGRQPGRNW